MKKTKSNLYPNKETMHSYYIQAIEPKNSEINAMFPDYHPMWVVQSQAKTVSAENFVLMRKSMLNISRHQCAAFLRVSESAVRRWENGSIAVPFMAFELLRLVFESVNFKLSHPSWQGWFVSQNGRLVSAENKNISFLPHELVYTNQIHQQKHFYEAEYERLNKEMVDYKLEIAELKAAAESYAVLDELKAIESRLADLSSRISNNKVVHLANSTKNKNPSLEAKVA